MLLFSVLAVGVASTFYFSQRHSSTADAGNGVWEGTFDINGKGNYHYTALHMNGRAVGSSDDARVIYRGDVSLSDGRYHSELEMFLMSGSPFDKATLEGVVPEPGRIEAHYRTHDAGDRGKLKLQLREGAGKQASLKSIAGPWILYRGFNILKLDINDAGAVSGGNTSGCAYDGKISPIDPGHNAYDAQLVVTSCDNLNGTWAGMAYLSDGIAPDDTLNLHLFEEGWAMLLSIVRNEDTRLIDERKEWNP